MRNHVAKAIALAIAVGLGSLAVAKEEPVSSSAAVSESREISIPAGELMEALKALMQQTGSDLVFRPEQVKGVKTEGVEGNLSTEQALEKLLKGTELRANTDRKSGAILIAVPIPVADVEFKKFRLAQATSTESVPAESTEDLKLEEVIVTAQKREQRVQDVPISMSVVTAADIDRRGLVSSEDYLRGIPGVNQSEGGALGQTIVIRGLETRTLLQNLSTGGSTVASYFGETPTTSAAGITASSSIDLKLVDIERVEVLRGPQGTAFGGASLGGTVRTIPVAPKLDRFEAKVGVGYSATSGTGGDNYNFQAVGNFPLISDKLALRAVGYRYTESGFYRNRADSNAAFQSDIARYDAEAFAIDEDEVGGSTFTGGRLAALFQASDALRMTLSYLKQKRETNGFAGAISGRYEQTVLQVAPEHRRRGETGQLYDEDIDIANAVLEYDLGRANLLATYSYTNSGSAGPHSYSIYELPWPWSSNLSSDFRAHVGEVRLTTQLDGAWNFLAGLYAEDLKDEGRENSLWYGDPAENFFATGERDLGGYAERRSMKQKAAFGEVSWELRQGLTLTSGVRAYQYDRAVRFDAEGALTGSIHRSSDGDASGTTFRANLSYKPNESTLLYGGWSQGFRFGRVQLAPPADACDVDSDGLIDGTSVSLESLTRLNSDEVDNYELGGKFTLLNRRLTLVADIFRMNWSGIPLDAVSRSTLSSSCWAAIVGTGAGTFANVGAARSEGVEFQANLYATDALRVDIGGSYIRARLRDGGSVLGALVGNRLPGAPEINANFGLQYDFTFAGKRPSVRIDATYVGPFYSGLQPVVTDRAGAYVKLDASVRVSLLDTYIDLFVRNLTNEDAFSARFAGFADPLYGMRLRPRTIGLQLSRDF